MFGLINPLPASNMQESLLSRSITPMYSGILFLVIEYPMVCKHYHFGSLAEWLIAPVLKTDVG